MSKSKQKDISFPEISLLCFVVAMMATSFVNLPLYGFFFKALGVGTIAYGVLDRKPKHNKFFEDIGLDINGKCPILMSKKDTPYGMILKFKKPYAITSEDFKKHAIALNEYFSDGKGEVVINFVNGYIFMEIHNKELESMYDLRDVSEKDLQTKGDSEFLIGETFGDIFALDIFKCVHILIAGESGGGKSNLVNLILTYLLRFKVFKLKMDVYLMDFKKGVELNRYAKHPNVKGLATDIGEAFNMLEELVEEMERRYVLFTRYELKDMESYNKKFPKKKINPIIVVVDEFSEFYLEKHKEAIKMFEVLVSRARAAGVILIIATQRPDREVVNGKIKANVPTRICFSVSDDVNSRIILNKSGGEDLRGDGHCLVRYKNKITEVQAYFMDEDYSKQLINESIAELKGESLEVAISETTIIKPTIGTFLSKKDGGEGVVSKDENISKTTPPTDNIELKKKDISILKALGKLVGDNDAKK